ncbi:hypothetical protein AAG589_21085 [Isoptericola sp. F-RaC21]|uniref:hypothetical protein n=1 Tax=Isoptericola sp. F-RaC21 TaxID=3141452 RepID=UPI00315B500A
MSQLDYSYPSDGLGTGGPLGPEDSSSAQRDYEARIEAAADAAGRAFDQAAPVRSDEFEVKFDGLGDVDIEPFVALRVEGFTEPYQVGIEFPGGDAAAPTFRTDLAPAFSAGAGMTVGDTFATVDAQEAAELLALMDAGSPALEEYVRAAHRAVAAGQAAYAEDPKSARVEELRTTGAARDAGEHERRVTRADSAVAQRLGAAFPSPAPPAPSTRRATPALPATRSPRSAGMVHER